MMMAMAASKVAKSLRKAPAPAFSANKLLLDQAVTSRFHG
jgi:hypothetical protein